ncbi:MAG TPA: GAF domain-containing protein [Candidatus Eremiobacteraceae bacterium]|nr:GAF domain-containing protein [Candidatus Eremiobacteraceae bacterium]
MRAYVYACVTTAIVLLFALAEWLSERFVSEHSRAASLALEIAIVVAATLLFRPLHQRVEAAVEAAFYRKKRLALDAVSKFRRELTSFSDTQQLLRRVVEAIDHYLEADACAVYVRRDVFRAEASSFERPADDVAFDDPLAVRMRSTGAPARPALLKSAARGSLAFPMTAAGDAVGFLLVDFKQHDDDPEAIQMLSGLAQDLGVALTALDPSLRARKPTVPNNIPADLAPLIGRAREAAEIKAAVAHAGLVTLTGAGGVGKTHIALHCAATSIAEHEYGAWFVTLAPITDGSLVAATILAALSGAGAEGGGDLAQLIGFLRSRDALIVVDNCEHVLAAAAAVIAQICAHCPHISIVATSRELLHLPGEQVYRLPPLRVDAAAELFARRASAVADGFDAETDAAIVRGICERLDCVPLAIELAAARVRALSVHEIAARLNERFKLVADARRTESPRRQTLEGTIQWSYDLLAPDEKALLRCLGVFRGTFSLEAASTVYGRDGAANEYRVLDLLTSLADKSLLTVRLALSTRYGLLEMIREFAENRAADASETAAAAARHAMYFAAVAADAYRAFDTRPPPGWLESLTPDIDNFRAALAWTLDGPGDRHLGSQLAADCGAIFLRLGLLGEGLHWCERALDVTDISQATAGRVEYIASMMHNNSLAHGRALEAAQRAVSRYRESSDERGLIRALSQTAYQFARAARFDEAAEPAAEAVRRAREGGDAHLLVAVLRRCAASLPPEQIARARPLFDEALSNARETKRPDEICHVLQWWASSEGAAGCYDRAMELLNEALPYADTDVQKYIESDLACCALAADAIEIAEPHARRALTLALESQHAVLIALSIAHCAPGLADRREGAVLWGYANARLGELQFERDRVETIALRNASRTIEATLGASVMALLIEEGSKLSQTDALALLPALSAVRVVERSHQIPGDVGVMTLLG